MALLSNKFRPNAVVDTSHLKHFEKKLQMLGGMTVKERRKEMQKVTNYAIRPTTANMKQRAAAIKRRGVLRDSVMTMGAKATGFGSRVGSRSGPKIRGTKKRKAYHAHLVELGTKKKVKTVKPGNKMFRFYSFKNRRWVFTKRIVHGSKAQPFIAPAYQQTKKQYLPRIKKKMAVILRTLITGGGRKSGVTKVGK